MDNKFNFETKLQRLDEIVQTMESKTLPLEESIALYEEGNAILKALEERLSVAECKISEITRKNDK